MPCLPSEERSRLPCRLRKPPPSSPLLWVSAECITVCTSESGRGQFFTWGCSLRLCQPFFPSLLSIETWQKFEQVSVLEEPHDDLGISHLMRKRQRDALEGWGDGPSLVGKASSFQGAFPCAVGPGMIVGKYQPKRFHREEKFDDGRTQKNSGSNSLFMYFCLEAQISVTMPETL